MKTPQPMHFVASLGSENLSGCVNYGHWGDNYRSQGDDYLNIFRIFA